MKLTLNKEKGPPLSRQAQVKHQSETHKTQRDFSMDAQDCYISDSAEIHQYRFNPTPEKEAAALQADWERDVQRSEKEATAYQSYLEREARRQEKAALALHLDRQRDELDQKTRKEKRERWEKHIAGRDAARDEKAKKKRAKNEINPFTEVFGVVKWEGNTSRYSTHILGQTVVVTLHPTGGYVVQVGTFNVPGIFTTSPGITHAVQAGLAVMKGGAYPEWITGGAV